MLSGSFSHLSGLLQHRAPRPHCICRAYVNEQHVSKPLAPLPQPVTPKQRDETVVVAPQSPRVVFSNSKDVTTGGQPGRPGTPLAEEVLLAGLRGAGSLVSTASDVAARLRRGFEPHPAGFPPGMICISLIS